MWNFRTSSKVRALQVLGGAAVLQLLAACLGPEGDPESLQLGTVTEPIIGGNLADNVDIGIYNFDGGGCTATLIAPRYALTAAHCAPTTDPHPINTVKATDNLTLTNAAGQQFSYTVDRVFTFSSRQGETVPNGMTNDVRLLHLATAVPASVAVPRGVSSVLPAAGGRSTIYGWGCTDRVTGVGGGVRRFLSFNYPDVTRGVCWGDSGGPVAHGNVNDGGWVWGINSNWKDRHLADGNQWPDWFADASEYKVQIRSLMTQWDASGGLERLTDRPGLDYQTYTGLFSAAACRDACEGDFLCKSFTFVEPPLQGPSSKCYLKSAAAEWGPGPSGVTSGVDFTMQRGYERTGSSYQAFDLAAGRPDQCFAACAADDRCNTYVYREQSASGPSRCWLMQGRGTAVERAGFITGQKRSYESGVDRPGTNYRSFVPSSLLGYRECKEACAAEEQCRSYSFDFNTKTCWLKDRIAPPVARSTVTSGAKAGLQVGINLAGSDVTSFLTSSQLPQTCQAACARDSRCKAWTYVKPRVQDATRAKCWLKSAVPSVSVDSNTTSGVKGADFF